MTCRALCLCVLLGGAAATSESARVTPIQKVLTLMEELKANAIKGKNEEEVKFSAFKQWCGDTQSSKTDEVKAGEAKMEELTAQIEKAAVLIRKLTERIQELDEDVARWKKDEKSAATVRAAEKEDYTATIVDYSESIAAVGQALTTLQKQPQDVSQAFFQASLLQVRSLRMMTQRSRTVLDSYLARANTPNSQAGQVNAYENQSGTVIDMLQKLQDQFSGEKRKLEKDELGAQQSYEQVAQQLADDIENANFEISKKTKVRAETQANKAELEGDLAQTTANRDEDQKYLEDTVALCNQKTADFESRQELRAGELVAISKAIEIISSQAVAGAGDKHLPALVQIREKHNAVLATLRSTQRSPNQRQVSLFLEEQAKRTGSTLLAEMAAQAMANPFVKVKKMIKDLMVKLMEEATSETEHKGWCDTELTTNKQTRDRKTSEASELTSLIEDLNATIQQLTQDIADLTSAVKELDVAMAKETEERSGAKATNKQTVKDAQGAQAAVEAATAVLKDFYAKSASATAFAQGPAEDAPETFDKPYKGALPEGGSIVDFLEVILSDFQRLEAETAAAEAEQEDAFKTFMFESKKDKALKEGEMKLKSQTKTDKESALAQATTDLKTTQEELNEALAYYEKLRPTCVDSGITYEERVKRREEEIVSLQEALKILAGNDLPTMA